jgi:hypothetical protein
MNISFLQKIEQKLDQSFGKELQVLWQNSGDKKILFRWVALVLVLIATLLLTSGDVNLQWIGWVVGAIASGVWAYFARLDKDIPRMLMELFYFLISLWGVYNWI